MFKLGDIIGHREIVQTLRNAVQRNRLAHAYLLMGPPGGGKKRVAEALAATLLCEHPSQGDACNCCRSCQQFSHENHPDYHLVAPSGATIKIEQMRELLRQVQYKPYQGVRQVFLVDKAETMTPEAANCFLKTLEEPTGETVFLLISHRPMALLPTILSRCQQLQFRPLKNQELALGLEKLLGMDPQQARKLAPMAGGSLDKALALADKSLWPAREKALGIWQELPDMSKLRALDLAEELSNDRGLAVETLELMRLWLRDLLVYNYTGNKEMLINRDMGDRVAAQTDWYDPARIMEILEDIGEAHDNLMANANTRLTLEALLLKIKTIGGSKYVR